MAVTNIKAAHLQADRNHPVDQHGKLRFLYAKLNQGAAAGDAGSTWELGDLPPGRVAILPHLCRYRVDALGAARVMKMGHRAYKSRADGVFTQEAEDDDALAVGVDVSAAVAANMNTTTANDEGGMAWEMWSAAGVRLFITVTGGTIPANATGEFLIAYVDVN